MTSILSVFAKPTHGNVWLDYVRQLRPYDVLILDPDIQQVSDAYQASPESEITIRRWEWDDGRTKQNPDGTYRVLRDDPEGLARQHAGQYGALVIEWEKEARRRGIPFPERDQLVVHLVNEPDTNSLMPQINRYTAVACKLLQDVGLKADALNLSTGHPAILKDGTPDWSPLAEAIDAIMQGDHYVVCHEYFNDLGIDHPTVHPWHIGRMSKWAPRGPRYKIGEFGLEMILNGRKNNHEGWIGNITPGQMVAATEWHLNSLRDDVVADRFYMTDFVDRAWRTFNSEPIHGQLIEVGRRHSSKPFASVPEKPDNSKPSRFLRGDILRTTTTVNARRTPGTQGKATDDVVQQLAPNSAVELLEGPQHADGLTWWRTEAGWLAEVAPNGITLLTNKADVPVPDDSNWERCIAFVARWEGGWIENLNDPGGPTNRGITIGTFTKWRQSQGRQIPTKEDLRNIGTVEVDEIYREWYWIASGADKLPWPNCLAVFDVAVNGGVDRAKQFIAEVGTDFVALMARRIDWYTRIVNFEYFGKAWIRRCADLMKTGA